MAAEFQDRPELRAATPVTPSSLGEQQRQALRLIGLGYDSRQLAEALQTTPVRAGRIATRLKHVLGVTTREELVTEARRIFGLDEERR